jgi:hypothetical protein
MDGSEAAVVQNLIPILAIAGGISVAIISIVVGGIRGVFETRSREASRREIAAFIAEGAMTPEQGEKLMAAGPSKKRSGCC